MKMDELHQNHNTPEKWDKKVKGVPSASGVKVYRAVAQLVKDRLVKARSV